MKSFKIFAFAAMLAVIAVGCNKVEKILPKKDGKWAGTSQTVAVYWDGTLLTTDTQTDSLGTITFEKDGRGTAYDYNGDVASTFAWEVNADNDKITINDDSTTTDMTYDIQESSKDAQKWFGSTSVTDSLLGTFKTDITMEMERVK
jgi:hypothetical protein